MIMDQSPLIDQGLTGIRMYSSLYLRLSSYLSVSMSVRRFKSDWDVDKMGDSQVSEIQTQSQDTGLWSALIDVSQRLKEC